MPVATTTASRGYLRRLAVVVVVATAPIYPTVGKTRFELDDDEDEVKVEDEGETGEGDSEDERNEPGLGNDDQYRLNRLFQKNGVFQKKCTSVVPSQSHLSTRTRVSKQGRLFSYYLYKFYSI